MFTKHHADVGDTSLSRLTSQLTSLIAATRRAEARVRDKPTGGFGDYGHAWKVFIASLDEWAESEGLATASGRGDTDKMSCEAQASPYVAFVAALLREIPPPYTIPITSIPALRARIMEARQER